MLSGTKESRQKSPAQRKIPGFHDHKLGTVTITWPNSFSTHPERAAVGCGRCLQSVRSGMLKGLGDFLPWSRLASSILREDWALPKPEA